MILMENFGFSWNTKISFKTPRKETFACIFFILKLEIGTVEREIDANYQLLLSLYDFAFTIVCYCHLLLGVLER